MSKAIQLHIPEPCHENWQQMTPQEQGRFCGSCRKMVIDFSVMSDKEILHYISSAGTQVCGRFANEQLNREIKKVENKRRFSLAYVWNLLLATVLFTESCTEREEVMGKMAIDEKPAAILLQQEIKGYILDSKTGAPVKGASVHIADHGKTVLSDSTGKFSLSIDTGDAFVLEVNASRYITKPVLVDNRSNWQNLEIMMTESPFTMGEVTIKEEKINK